MEDLLAVKVPIVGAAGPAVVPVAGEVVLVADEVVPAEARTEARAQQLYDEGLRAVQSSIIKAGRKS